MENSSHVNIWKQHVRGGLRRKPWGLPTFKFSFFFLFFFFQESELVHWVVWTWQSIQKMASFFSPIIAFKPFHPGLYLAPLIFIKFSIFKCSYFYILKSLDQSKWKLLSKSFHRSKRSSFFQLQPDSGYQSWSEGRLWSVLSLFLCHISPTHSFSGS